MVANKHKYFRTGSPVRCIKNAKIYNTDILISDYEGIIIAEASTVLIIELSESTIESIADNFREYCIAESLPNSIAVVSKSDVELISDKIYRTQFQFAKANNSNWKDLAVALIMFGLSIIPLIFTVQTIILLISGTPIPNKINPAILLLPAIFALISMSFMISFLRSYIVHKRILWSKFSAICPVLIFNISKIGYTARYDIYFLFSNMVVSQRVPYSKFKNFQQEDKVTINYLENNPILCKILF